jgi:hypothetical protein
MGSSTHSRGNLKLNRSHYHRGGTVTLHASRVATAIYTAAATTNFSVAGETPNFTFAAIPNQTYGLRRSRSQQLRTLRCYLLRRQQRPGQFVGNVVTISGIGTVTLIADQAASGAYSAGVASISFSVAAATPTLSFAAIANQTYGGCTLPSLDDLELARRY